MSESMKTVSRAIIYVCDDYQRLRLAEGSQNRREQCAREVERPWDVAIYQSDTSRNPISERFRTLAEAASFVSQLTGHSTFLWVHTGTNPLFSFQAFTGKYADRYNDTAQYRQVSPSVWASALSLYGEVA